MGKLRKGSTPRHALPKAIVNALQKPVEMEPTLENVRIWMAYADITAENMDDMLWKVDRAIENCGSCARLWKLV